MSLYERLSKARGTEEAESAAGDGLVAPDSPAPRQADPLDALKKKIHQSLVQALGPKLYDMNMTAEQLEFRVRQKLSEVLADDETPLSAADRNRLISETTDDILGYGPLEPFLRDDSVTEIMVNNFTTVYIERDGKLHPTNGRFLDDSHLRRTIDKIVGQVGRRIDESSPYVDARLPDGSRVNAVVHPVAIGGPFLTIRKFSKDPYTIGDLIAFGSITPQVAHFVDACVRGRLNVIVSGGTGTGKTTLLNVLSSFIPNDERIVTIEDPKELKLWQDHVRPLESRPPN